MGRRNFEQKPTKWMFEEDQSSLSDRNNGQKHLRWYKKNSTICTSKEMFSLFSNQNKTYKSKIDT